MSNFPTFHESVVVTTKVDEVLAGILKEYPDDKVFLVTEETVEKRCIPLIEMTQGFQNLKKVVIPAGEANKKLESVALIWQFLSENHADRKSLVVNLGGGMLTDMGSFAASTFKRGTDFVNIPTTLLAQVDASVGGKTGFNFNGYKNEIGIINQPRDVLIDPRFLKSIDKLNFVSGYAEMIKHGLIDDVAHLKEVREFDLDRLDYNLLAGIIARSVAIKDKFVHEDPNERGIRKALNFGHTVGHAFESCAMSQGSPILHGHAVAYGMIAELYLSYKMCGFSLADLDALAEWLIAVYGKFEIDESDFEILYQLMTHDKKNEGNRINFTLIPAVGEVAINQNTDKETIFAALKYYQNL